MNALLVSDNHNLACWFSDDAIALKQDALAVASLVGTVASAEQNEQAVKAQAGLSQLAKLVEEHRKAAKAPILAFGKSIDAAAKDFLGEITAEQTRLATLVGNYQSLLLAKQRAEDAARNKELQEIERQRQAEIAKAKDHSALDAINTLFDQRAADQARPIEAPIRAEGQAVREVWEIESINEWVLARARPDLVRKIEFDMVAVKQALEHGSLPGVKARKAVKATVRVASQKAIDVVNDPSSETRAK